MRRCCGGGAQAASRVVPTGDQSYINMDPKVPRRAPVQLVYRAIAATPRHGTIFPYCRWAWDSTEKQSRGQQALRWSATKALEVVTKRHPGKIVPGRAVATIHRQRGRRAAGRRPLFYMIMSACGRWHCRLCPLRAGTPARVQQRLCVLRDWRSDQFKGARGAGCRCVAARLAQVACTRSKSRESYCRSGSAGTQKTGRRIW